MRKIFNGRDGGMSVSPITAKVPADQSGNLYLLRHSLGSTSTLALIAGTNANLALVGDYISATAGIADGQSQIAVVREEESNLAIEYPVTLNAFAVPVLPGAISDLAVVSTTTDSAQLSFTDAAGADSHEYVLDSGEAVALGSDKIVSGLTAETTYAVQVRGVNAVGDGELSNSAEIVTSALAPDPTPLIRSSFAAMTGQPDGAALSLAGDEAAVTGDTFEEIDPVRGDLLRDRRNWLQYSNSLAGDTAHVENGQLVISGVAGSRIIYAYTGIDPENTTQRAGGRFLSGGTSAYLMANFATRGANFTAYVVRISSATNLRLGTLSGTTFTQINSITVTDLFNSLLELETIPAGDGLSVTLNVYVNGSLVHTAVDSTVLLMGGYPGFTVNTTQTMGAWCNEWVVGTGTPATALPTISAQTLEANTGFANWQAPEDAWLHDLYHLVPVFAEIPAGFSLTAGNDEGYFQVVLDRYLALTAEGAAAGAAALHDTVLTVQGTYANGGAASATLTLTFPTNVRYVDFAAGDDSNDGLTPGAPWKHAPGDAAATGVADAYATTDSLIVFKGGVWYSGEIQMIPETVYHGWTEWNTGSALTEGDSIYRAGLDGSVDDSAGWTACTSQADAGGNPLWAQMYKKTYGAALEFDQIYIDNDEIAYPAAAVTPADLFYCTGVNGDATKGCWVVNYSTVFNTGTPDQWTATDANIGATFSETADLTGYVALLWGAGNGSILRKILSHTPGTDIVVIDRDGTESLNVSNGIGGWSIWGHPESVKVPYQYGFSSDGLTRYMIGDPSTRRICTYHSAFTQTGDGEYAHGFVIRGYWSPEYLDPDTPGEDTGTAYYAFPLSESRVGGGLVNCKIRHIRNGGTAGAALRGRYSGSVTWEGAIIERNVVETCPRSSGIRVSIANNLTPCQPNGGAVESGTGKGLFNSKIRLNQICNLDRTAIYNSGSYGGLEIDSNYLADLSTIHGNGITLYFNNVAPKVRNNVILNVARPMTLDNDKSGHGTDVVNDMEINGNIFECAYDPVLNNSPPMRIYGGIIGVDLTRNLMVLQPGSEESGYAFGGGTRAVSDVVMANNVMQGYNIDSGDTTTFTDNLQTSKTGPWLPKFAGESWARLLTPKIIDTLGEGRIGPFAIGAAAGAGEEAAEYVAYEMA